MKKKVNGKLALIIIFIAAIVAILTAFVTILVVFHNDNDAEMSALFWLMVSAFIAGFFFLQLLIVLLYRKKMYSVKLTIDSVNSINESQEEIFKVGSIIYNKQQTITFVSTWLYKEGFKKFLGKKISKLGIEFESGNTQYWEYKNHTWEVVILENDKTLLLKDVTYQTLLKNSIIDSRIAIASFHISYSKKINFNDAQKSEASLKINQIIQSWAIKINGIYNKLALTENTSTVAFRWMDGKTDVQQELILKKIKDSISKNLKDLNISIGVAYGAELMINILNRSLTALEVGKNRGGDQIVIEKSTGEIEYIGASSLSNTNNNIRDLKLFNDVFIGKIKSAKEIFITSHKMADLDALGAALGLYEIISLNKKTAFIILEELDSTAKELYDNLPKSIKASFIRQEEAYKMMTNRSTTILVDTSNIDLTQASVIIEETNIQNIFVIDHHRVGQNSIKSLPALTMIDTGSSSASEIVVEMIKLWFNNNPHLTINNSIATALLAGIKLDSKQLTKNVTETTFEAVSFLLNNDADSKTTEELFKVSFDLIKSEYDALNNFKMIKKGVIFTFISETYVVKDEEISIMCDKFLEYKDVEVVYLLGKTNNKYKLSARSNGNINVQLVAEALGGGGHYNAAAASWPKKLKYNTLKKKIISEISKGE